MRTKHPKGARGYQAGNLSKRSAQDITAPIDDQFYLDDTQLSSKNDQDNGDNACEQEVEVCDVNLFGSQKFL